MRGASWTPKCHPVVSGLRWLGVSGVGLILVASACDARFEFDKPVEAGVVDCSQACAEWGGNCVQSGQVCVECGADADCKNNSHGTRCSDANRCVQCLTAKDCPNEASYVCVGSECKLKCTVDQDRDGDSEACEQLRARCNRSGFCAECNDNNDCRQAGRPYCLNCGYCAACASDAHCSSPTPVCDLVQHICVECSNGTNCPSGVCDLSTHQCYAVRAP